jgi:hypothetical protein
MLPTPNVLAAAAMEVVRQMNEVDTEAEGASVATRDVPQRDGERDEAERREREQAGEPYCEYFRRQLAHVECVEDFLAETE